MDTGRVLGRGISFPPRIGANGQWAWSEGSENIRESIRVILLTEFNERVLLPMFGSNLNRYLFEPNTVATRHSIADRIEKALAAWEPRIGVESVAVEPLDNDPSSALVTITYRPIASQSRERVGLTVDFSG